MDFQYRSIQKKSLEPPTVSGHGNSPFISLACSGSDPSLHSCTKILRSTSLGPASGAPWENAALTMDMDMDISHRLKPAKTIEMTITQMQYFYFQLKFWRSGSHLWQDFSYTRPKWYCADQKMDFPANYALTYLELSDILNLLKVSKWKSPIQNACRLQEPQREVIKLCLFVLLAVSVTLLANLMGPSTGVLILPSVQSVDQGRSVSERFVQIESHIPPSHSSSLSNCTSIALKQTRIFMC